MIATTKKHKSFIVFHSINNSFLNTCYLLNIVKHIRALTNSINNNKIHFTIQNSF